MNNPAEVKIAYQLVDSQDMLDQVLPLFRERGNLSLDIESNSFYRYRESTCLIQAATPEAVYIIDPLALDDLSPLGDVLADPYVEKIFHNADYDLRSLDRDYGFRIRNVFDTSIGAAFLGLRTLGLDRVLETYVGITVEKHKSMQRSDWGRRPLPEPALDYAAQDVLHLLPLRNRLHEQLKAAGRLEWVREEFERLELIRHTPPAGAETSWHDVKGLGKLKPAEKAIFREVYAFRDEEARKKDRPPCKILPNELLFRLAASPEEASALLPGMPRNAPAEFFQGLRKAVEKGLQSPPHHEVSGPGPSRDEQGRIRENLKKLKEWRTRMAEPLQLDPPLIWPTRHLELLARTPVTELTNPLDDLGRPLVRSWQMQQFAEELRKQIKTLRV